MNKFIGIGRLTQNPANYSTTSGKTYCKFSIAITRQFENAKGEKETDYINCTCFTKQAEYILKYLSKGSLVAVEGRLQTNKYYDERSQKNIYTTDVITDNVKFLDSKKKETLPNQNITNTEIVQSVMNDEDPFEQFGLQTSDEEFELPF